MFPSLFCKDFNAPVNIEQYFTKEEFAAICEYEKLRMCNIKRNYEMMVKMGKW